MKKESFINRVSIVGLGKLGASMLAGMASRGFEVVGVDVDERVVDAINHGMAPVHETGLAEMIFKNKDRIRATLDYRDAILSSDITFVIVPTPSDARGAFSTALVEKAFAEIGLALREKKSYHLIVLTSTVLPGATRQILLPIIEKQSGKKCGEQFGLCYSPEFIALGTVIRDFLNPDFYLVGQFDDRSGLALENVNSRVALNNAKSKRMSIENAELAKVSINGFITLKISYANMLSDLCEKIPGGDIDVVSDALGMDTRIGRKYLTGGFGFGGPCFPRDNVALSFIADQLGVDCSIPRTNHFFNVGISERATKKLSKIFNHGQKIGVLGLAYKPLSHVIEESSGIGLCLCLANAGYEIYAHDPLANESARVELSNSKVKILDDLLELVYNCDVLIVATPDKVYETMIPDILFRSKKEVTVVDFWRVLQNKIPSDPKIKYLPLGRCVDDYIATSNLMKVWHVAT